MGHRLFTITPDDHRGQVWTVSVIFGIFSVMVLGLRGFIGHGNLGPDDWSAAAATVSCTTLKKVWYTLTEPFSGIGIGTTRGHSCCGHERPRTERWQDIQVQYWQCKSY